MLQYKRPRRFPAGRISSVKTAIGLPMQKKPSHHAGDWTFPKNNAEIT